MSQHKKKAFFEKLGEQYANKPPAIPVQQIKDTAEGLQQYMGVLATVKVKHFYDSDIGRFKAVLVLETAEGGTPVELLTISYPAPHPELAYTMQGFPLMIDGPELGETMVAYRSDEFEDKWNEALRRTSSVWEEMKHLLSEIEA